jgi:hypothetical protein
MSGEQKLPLVKYKLFHLKSDVDAQKRQSACPFRHHRHAQQVNASELLAQCNLVLPLSVSSIVLFPYGHSLVAYIFFLVFSLSLSIFPSITCIENKLQRKMWLIQIAFLRLILCRPFLSTSTQRNTFFSIYRS